MYLIFYEFRFMPYILLFFIILLGAFNIFLFLLWKKILRLEAKIIEKLIQRSSLIPSFYDISKPYLVRHDTIFKEILHLRNIEFFECWNGIDFFKIIETEYKIHNELSFIIKLCSKHQKLLKNGNFILLKDILIDLSYDIWENVALHKQISKKYNTFVFIDKLFLIWLVVPLEKINEI